MNYDYSVGIPVRNEENSIRDTLESILAQTLRPKQIFVCVNGSTDSTFDIVEEISKKESVIKVLKSNPGKPNAWHKIIAETRTNYNLFCDGDVIINKTAAEELINTLENKPKLILVSGSNAYTTSNANSFFSKYFAENLSGTQIQQGWICGRLYMLKINELRSLCSKLNIELMPTDIINEDGFLEMVSTNYREIIASAYNLSAQVNSFDDWLTAYKRVLAGQFQLKEKFPEHFGDSEISLNRLKNYYNRFKNIDGVSRKLGLGTLFAIRLGLNIYYKFNREKLSQNNIWTQTTSTKVKLT